jgi:hypothetical protein
MFSDTVRKRPRQLVPRLASEEEVVSSVRAIARVLAVDGKGFHDQANAATRAAVAAYTEVRDDLIVEAAAPPPVVMLWPQPAPTTSRTLRVMGAHPQSPESFHSPRHTAVEHRDRHHHHILLRVWGCKGVGVVLIFRGGARSAPRSIGSHPPLYGVWGDGTQHRAGRRGRGPAPFTFAPRLPESAPPPSSRLPAPQRPGPRYDLDPAHAAGKRWSR